MSRLRWRPAYVGLGSNLEDPVSQLQRAFVALSEIADSVLVSRSSLYRSAPLDGSDQPDYVNAVAGLLTRKSAIDFLQALQRVETDQGRLRDGRRWQPRTLDLDLLSLAGETVTSKQLTLPHPGIAERNFVLLPWREISPQVFVPGLATVADLADRAPSEPHLERLAQ